LIIKIGSCGWILTFGVTTSVSMQKHIEAIILQWFPSRSSKMFSRTLHLFS
jgi:hypothetical protein